MSIGVTPQQFISGPVCGCLGPYEGDAMCPCAMQRAGLTPNWPKPDPDFGRKLEEAIGHLNTRQEKEA